MLSVRSIHVRRVFGLLSLTNTTAQIMVKTRRSSALVSASEEDGAERPSKRVKLDDEVEAVAVESTLPYPRMV
jgi:hypothetical protein